MSTYEVASALGVSVSTVKRWVDDGILPAHKTHGGHRKLLAADVLRYARENDFPNAKLAHIEALEVPGTPESVSAKLLAALQRGSAETVRRIILETYNGGMAMTVLADQVIAPAMRELGKDWECGRIDVYEEHRGTQLCAAALYELKAQIEAHGEPNRPQALGGCLSGDHYTLASLLAQMVLLEAGWDAINLGPNTPARSFIKAIDDLQPKLLWLSTSHIPERGEFIKDCNQLFEHADAAGVLMALGGQALTEDIRRQTGYAAFGDQLAQLAACARRLHTLPQRPRRGRPV